MNESGLRAGAQSHFIRLSFCRHLIPSMRGSSHGNRRLFIQSDMLVVEEERGL